MVKDTIGILALPQREFNRQIYRLVKQGLNGDITALEEAVEALETVVGDSTAGIVKDVNDIKAVIGDESTADSILGRIKALEDAQ